jgi:uncharacterized protein (TIGR02118 family)
VIKFVAAMRRIPALTHDQFVDYHRSQHAELFMSLPEVRTHVRRYIQSHPVQVSLPGLDTSSFDGLTEIWFDDIDGLKGVFDSPSYLTRIRPDEEKFIDLARSEVMVTTEFAVHDPHD